MINEATNSHKVFGFMTFMKPWIHFPLEKLNCRWTTELALHNKRVPRDIGFMLMNSMKQFTWNNKALHLVWQPIAMLQSMSYIGNEQLVSVSHLQSREAMLTRFYQTWKQWWFCLCSYAFISSRHSACPAGQIEGVLSRLLWILMHWCVCRRLGWRREHFRTVVSVSFGSDGDWMGETHIVLGCFTP